MRSISGATAAALALAVGATQPARAQTMGELLNDDDHRYRLEITVGQESAVGGDNMPTIFCLSPALEDKIEVCLGDHQGHSFNFGNQIIISFKEIPDSDGLCRCERPVVLSADRPLCWSMTASVPKVGVTNVEVDGFVTILEDVHEIGATAESCINAYSNRVPLTIKLTKDDGNRPAKRPPPRLQS